VTIGALGGLLGAAAGYAVVSALGHHGLTFHFPGSAVPFVLMPFMRPSYLLQVLLMATGGAGLFAIYPAFRASRLRPVEALAGK
jgi:putative ABC transport system permease protein